MDSTDTSVLGRRTVRESQFCLRDGLIIDENLSWKAHIHEISKKVSSGIGALKGNLHSDKKLTSNHMK